MKKIGRFLPVLVLVTFLILTNPLLVTFSASTTQISNEGAPVFFEGKTIFSIKKNLGPLTPQYRAQTITQKLETLAKNLSVSLDSVKVDEYGGVLYITAQGIPLMNISQEDAQAEGKSQEELAQDYISKISKYISQYRNQYSIHHLILAAIHTVIVTIVFLAIFIIINRIFSRLYRKLASWENTKIRSISLQNFDLLSSKQITQFLISLTRIFYWTIVLILSGIYITLVFSFFPWTKSLGTNLPHFILGIIANAGKEFLEYLPNLVILILIIGLTYFTIQFLRPIVRAVDEGNISLPGFYPEWAQPSFKLLSFLIIALAIVVAFPYLPGFGSPAFQGVSVFIGILFSIGSSSAIANIVAGSILIYTRGFREGDRVKIGDTFGRVVETTLFVTRLVTPKHVVISIPNSQIFSSSIENYDLAQRQLQKHLIIHTEIHLGYEVPWRKAHQTLCIAALRTDWVMTSPSPFVLQKTLDDVYVVYELNVCVSPEADLENVFSQLHQNIQDCFTEAEIRIFAPNYEADPTTYPFSLEVNQYENGHHLQEN